MSSNPKPRLPSRPPGSTSVSAFPAEDPYSPSASLTAPSSPQVSPEVRRQSTISREDLLRTRLAQRSDEFTEALPLLLRLCTWNVNAKRPDEDISPWLLSREQADAYSQYDVDTLDIDASHLEEPDIYAIGFQEIVDLSASNLLIENEGATRPWEDKIERLLKQRYVQKHKSSLVGLALLVYVKRGLAEYVSDIAVDKVGVGIMGVGGNKGAVAVRMNVYDSRICFVNSHLAAHQHNVAGRNSDYSNIMQKVAQPAKFHDKRSNSSLKILGHDHVFWIGDLNYRIDGFDLNGFEAKIKARDWEALQQGDQLLREKRDKGEAGPFAQFHEAPLSFAPTYKFTPGTDEYEWKDEKAKKKRLPAWCDRIQWTGEGVECCIYDSVPLHTSDHKPVYGLYRVQAKVVIAEKLEAVRTELVQQLLQELDERENDAMPKIDISPTTVHFGRVLFDAEVKRLCTVTNSGASVAQWAFKSRSNTAGVHKPWLTVAPPFGLIPVGESQDITVTIHVTSETSLALMTGEDVLEDILFLGLENGSAAFITVSGEYRRSAFGCSVEYLVNQPGPVRLSSPGSVGGKAGTVLSLPKEIWRLVDYLYTRGMDTPELFLTNGVQTEVEAIIDCVDTGAELGSYNIHSVAECFVYLLKQMPEPIFPKALVDEFDDAGEKRLVPERLKSFCREYALSRLSPAHYNAFVYLVAFLREVLSHHKENRLHPVQLTLVFASALMHYNLDDSDPTLGLRPDQNKPKAWQILRFYLVSPEFP